MGYEAPEGLDIAVVPGPDVLRQPFERFRPCDCLRVSLQIRKYSFKIARMIRAGGITGEPVSERWVAAACEAGKERP